MYERQRRDKIRRKRFWIVALVLALVLALLPARHIAWAATVTVNSTTDVSDGDTSSIANLIADPGPDGVISLREAIEAANNTPGSDTINFSIPGGGVCTIQPTSALPALTDDGITIDGYSQLGTAEATDGTPATLLIEIDGTNAGSANGLTIESSYNGIRGLVINRFGWSGVIISDTTAIGNTIVGNYIGTNVDGEVDQGNGWHGVWICNGPQNNTVGGDTAAERNVISGNDTYGVYIRGSGTMSNTVSGNYIGTTANGTAALGNGWSGVRIAWGAQNNTIGGDTTVERNVISGNDLDGVLIEYNGTAGNTVSGNHIGTDANGTVDLGNGRYGVEISDGAQNNIIEQNVISSNNLDGVYIHENDTTGNTVSGNYIGIAANGTDDLGNGGAGVHILDGPQNNTIEQNVISCNDEGGVVVWGSSTTGNTVSGNYIGTDESGTLDRGNGRNGVAVGGGAWNNTVGGDTTVERNVISGNDWEGVYIASGMGNTVSGNYIGTDKSGTLDRGNGRHGVNIDGSANTIGGDTEGERNVISGNDLDGVYISGSFTTDNTVSGNYIGIAANGTDALGNARNGVIIGVGAQNNTIGGDTAAERNVISGNDWGGVYIRGSSTTGNTVSGNYIGTDASGTADRGNAEHGVNIYSSAQNNTVGPSNVIAHNGWDGVEVYGSDTTGNTITQNSIFSNTMGIDLTGGANGGIAAPVIVTTTVGSINVVGTACADCTVEVFENGDTDGEGETYVGDTTATASGAFTVTVSSLTQPYLTATATDAISGTSEFSEVFTATVPLAPPVSPIYLPIILKNH